MLLATAMVVSLLTGCGSKNNSAADTTKEETQTEATAEAAADESNDTTADDAGEETTITVFAAKSLNQVMEGNVENNEVIIDVAHDAKDDSWIQYEKGAAAKKINLDDCEEYIVEKKYIKRNERIVDEIIEKSSVTLKVFRNSIVMNRKSNL